MPRSPEHNFAAAAPADGQPGAATALTINGVTLTALETKFMVNMVATLEVKPAVNWEKLAEIMGVKGKKSKFPSLWACLLPVDCGCCCLVCLDCLFGLLCFT
jgi:hypothetical protein